MTSGGVPIYVDARCLQDPQYQFRGVGQHVSALLRTRARSDARNYRTIALVDALLPALPQEYQQQFDSVSLCLNHSFPSSGSIFINASPMTHPQVFSLRFISHQNLLTASIVYDFIPFDWPGYLPQVSHRIDYLSKLSRLKSSTLFLPISDYSAKRLREVLGARQEDILVTGACVRSSLFDAVRSLALPGQASVSKEATPYVLTVGGGDRRKNTGAAVRAVYQLNEQSGDKLRLRIVGDHGAPYRSDLERIAGDKQDWLEFCPHVDDVTLAKLYSGAVATIVPSYIEGFSLPVVEAAVCHSPVIASTCAAHLELISRREALFNPDNVPEALECLRRVVTDSEFRKELKSSQAHLADHYHQDAVGNRFWTFLVQGFERQFPSRAPSIRKRVKPKIAILSPFPPEQSGVARFTERTLPAAQAHFDIDLFTNAPRPLHLPDGVRDCGDIGIQVLVKGKYDSILSVIGNSSYHKPIFEFVERYGSPCILHDSRLTHIYFDRLGEQGFLDFASKLLGRPVSIHEVRVWLQDQQVPSLFVEPILERSPLLIVHTKPYQRLLRERYGFDAEVTTFPPNMEFTEEELTEFSRSAARRRLGIREGVFAISSFGFVSRSKGVFACIVALDQLRWWNVPAELFLVGDTVGIGPAVKHVASSFGVLDHVHLTEEFVPPDRYRDFMIASDAAVQLRTYDFGQPSAALCDCISAGMPTVAGCSLAETCDAPSFVARIPDNTSTLLLAERLAEIWERRVRRVDTAEERILYCKQHSFRHYATRLVEILNL